MRVYCPSPLSMMIETGSVQVKWVSFLSMLKLYLRNFDCQERRPRDIGLPRDSNESVAEVLSNFIRH